MYETRPIFRVATNVEMMTREDIIINIKQTSNRKKMWKECGTCRGNKDSSMESFRDAEGAALAIVQRLASVTAPLAWGLYSEHRDDCIIRSRGAPVPLTGVVANAIQAQRWGGPRDGTAQTLSSAYAQRVK